MVYQLRMHVCMHAPPYKKIGARSKQTRCSVVGKAPISTNAVTDRLNGLIG